MVSAPSDMAVQFAPRAPLARLKLSVAVPVPPVPPPPPPVGGQVTATLVTLADARVPVPLATVQVWPVGLVLTVTV